ncbi:helix-turn-helix domain-containing protein [Dyadobacter sp. Leaf189]|uniref:AraC family transcriptional regulator n=1 Tax=Dyadobacter sp. Leaf189 TaxID=1736295 RepID=UPI0006F454BD|nr:helix-turn-helix domain-containing protein [Dyadobacter sp. Leaf189]KQS30854.1 hypothetical protein ASG33_10795 [Dyadobacter sp. Leaf189]
MQRPATTALSQLIKHFLIIDSDVAANRNLRMFSDGNTGMVFNYKDPILIRQDGQPAALLPACFMYGPFRQYQDMTATGRIGLLVAVFHPFAFSSMLKIQANNMVDQIVDLESVYQQEASGVFDRICNASDYDAKIRVVEDFFLEKLSNFKPVSPYAIQAVKLIQQRNGDVPVSALLSSLQISERKLERVFQDNIGYPAKKFAGIIKVQHFLRLLRQNRPSNYTGLVYESGFFDQAHSIRVMKNISGLTPGDYIANAHLLAANFLEMHI